MMNSLWWKILVLALVTISSTAHAQSCSDIIDKGIFDFSRDNTTLTMSRDWVNWLCSHKTATYDSAKKESLTVGISIPDYGDFNLGSGSDAKSWSQAVDDLCKSESSRSSFSKKIDTEWRRVNAQLVDAWTTCMTQPGLKCWVRAPEKEGAFVWSARFVPQISGGPQSILINDFQFASDKATCKGPMNGKRIDIGGISTRCDRVGVPGDIIVMQGDYMSCNVAIPPKYTPPTLRDLIVDGKPVTVYFDNPTPAFQGFVKKDAPYLFKWDKRIATWTTAKGLDARTGKELDSPCGPGIWGPPPAPQDPPNPEDRQICLWGARLFFTEEGKVFDSNGPNATLIGHLDMK